MLTNHTDITLLCSKQNGRETIWMSHRIADVNFFGTDKLLSGDGESTNNEEYVVRIPEYSLKRYVDKYTWKSLPADEAFNWFTIKKGDYIIKGFIDEGIQVIGDILKKYNVLKIIGVTENLTASPYSRHIKLVVK